MIFPVRLKPKESANLHIPITCISRDLPEIDEDTVNKLLFNFIALRFDQI